MKRLVIPNGMYGDALVSGARVALIPGSHLETHQGNINLPSGEKFGVIFPRVSDVIGFQFAGVCHDTDALGWWHEDHWTFGAPITGVSPVIFDRYGTLHINDGSAGSQGYRYCDEQGRLVTGDASYYDQAHDLSEYTIAGDVRVGQSHDNNRDDAIVFIDGARRLLEPGPCRFIRVDRVGNDFAITLCKFERNQVQHIWATRAELASLPLVAGLPPVVKPPVPDTPPAPKPTPKPPTPVPIPGPIVPTSGTPLKSNRVWFGPNIKSIDLIDLFRFPEQWAQARESIGVFQFYSQQITSYIPAVGPNTYEALVAVDAFKKLTEWGIAIAVETGSVKPGDCKAVGHLNELPTLFQRIHDAGGTLSYISMDEPLTGEKQGKCPNTLAETADAVANFIKTGRVLGAKVGWVEAWPEIDLETQRYFLMLLDERGQLPNYWHLDIDHRRQQIDETTADAIDAIHEDYGIPFGVVMAGYPSLTDAAYSADVLAWAQTVDFIDLSPDHVIVQSWATRGEGGQQDVPKNLGEDGHAALVSAVVRVFA